MTRSGGIGRSEIRVTSVGRVEVCWGGVGEVSGWFWKVSGRCVGVGRGGQGRMRAWGVRGACVGCACLAISVCIARSALLSGYLGKSGHLPRYRM